MFGMFISAVWNLAILCDLKKATPSTGPGDKKVMSLQGQGCQSPTTVLSRLKPSFPCCNLRGR